MFQISLRAARVNAGFNQSSIADALNVDRTTIINWEKGKTSPRYDQLRGLCELYKIPIDYIFCERSHLKENS